ncbi:MAG: hypothetical protein ACPG06_02510 [Alphaproteobacteria bacterium]
MRWMMKFAVAFFVLIAHPVWAEDGFLTAASDVPLMMPLSELASSSIIFDKPGGRIIDVVLTGNTTTNAVEGFYAQTLVALGWQSVAPLPQDAAPHAAQPSLAFQNEWERLTLAFEGRHKGALHVRVTITPLSDLPNSTH